MIIGTISIWPEGFRRNSKDLIGPPGGDLRQGALHRITNAHIDEAISQGFHRKQKEAFPTYAIPSSLQLIYQDDYPKTKVSSSATRPRHLPFPHLMTTLCDREYDASQPGSIIPLISSWEYCRQSEELLHP